MKILSVGDIHNRASFRRWILDQAPRFDAVCLAGDLLDMFDTDEAGLRRQAESTLKWLSAFPSGTRVFAVTGNHDAWQDETPAYDQGAWLQRARRPGVSVDGDVVRVGDITFVCYPCLARERGFCPIVARSCRVLAAHRGARIRSTMPKNFLQRCQSPLAFRS